MILVCRFWPYFLPTASLRIIDFRLLGRKQCIPGFCSPHLCHIEIIFDLLHFCLQFRFHSLMLMRVRRRNTRLNMFLSLGSHIISFIHIAFFC